MDDGGAGWEGGSGGRFPLRFPPDPLLDPPSSKPAPWGDPGAPGGPFWAVGTPPSGLPALKVGGIVEWVSRKVPLRIEEIYNQAIFDSACTSKHM